MAEGLEWHAMLQRVQRGMQREQSKTTCSARCGRVHTAIAGCRMHSLVAGGMRGMPPSRHASQRQCGTAMRRRKRKKGAGEREWLRGGGEKDRVRGTSKPKEFTH